MIFQQLLYHDDADGIDILARHVARHYFADAADGVVVNADAETADLLADLLKAIALE